jgi:hypothetical protein
MSRLRAVIAAGLMVAALAAMPAGVGADEPVELDPEATAAQPGGTGGFIDEGGIDEEDRPGTPATRTPRNGAVAKDTAPTGTVEVEGGPAAPSGRAAASPTFTGLSQIPQGSYGSGFPPDTSLARGPSRVLQVTNRRALLTTSSGGVYQVTDLNRFFGAVNSSGQPVGDALFDPKVVYDRGSQTYFAVALQGQTGSFSRIYIAVSRPVQPTSLTDTQWCRYYVDARITYGGVSSWADYPGLGLGANTLLVTTNNFTSSFQGSAVRAWSKTYLARNTNACPAFQSPYLWTTYGSAGTRLPFTMQPALHYTSPTSATNATSPAYLIDAVRGGSQYYRVWKIANLSTGAPLLFGPTFVQGSWSVYDPDRLSPGGASNIGIDSGDARVLQVAGLGNRLHAVHTTRCQAGSGVNETCVRYIQLAVGNNSNGSIASSFTQQSVLTGGDGWYYTYPSVAVNNSGAAAAAFNAAGVGGYRGSAWAVKPATSASFQNTTWLAQGNCLLTATYQQTRGHYRAGDYSGAAADPDGSSIWVSTERSANITGVGCGWQTHITRLTNI